MTIVKNSDALIKQLADILEIDLGDEKLICGLDIKLRVGSPAEVSISKLVEDKAATVTNDMVKELRNKTGMGFQCCKKALIDAKGIMENAENLVRKAMI